ncbi:hypothetical protein [Burkholderia glumae]|uniref:hypothetical protein n=1 Tax=Burkholderia glumae TaxID=337 RepID=UPI0021500A09|nr:hypothetical protein [Burkholderia glumae]
MGAQVKFDPINSPVDTNVIPHLSDTASKARRFLIRRTSRDIRDAQEIVDGWIESYFEAAFEDEVRYLRDRAEQGNESAMEYFRVECRTIGDHPYDYLFEIGEFKEYCRDSLDIPHAGNTTDGEALDLCIDWFDVSETVFGEDSEPLFFAALSLKHVEKAMQFLERWRNPDGDSLAVDNMLVELHDAVENLVIKQGRESCEVYPPLSLDFKIACEAAMDALEAIVLADKYAHANKLKNKFKEISAQAVSAAEREQRKLHEIEEIQRKRERTLRLNEKREAKRLQAKSLVEGHWTKDTAQFSSAEDAGKFYSEWLSTLSGNNFKFAPSTCRDWVRDKAKEIGVKWR